MLVGPPLIQLAAYTFHSYLFESTRIQSNGFSNVFSCKTIYKNHQINNIRKSIWRAIVIHVLLTCCFKVSSQNRTFVDRKSASLEMYFILKH